MRANSLVVHQLACQQWWSESTEVYYIVRNSIDLSGIYEEMDLEMIRTTFNFGDYRNGVGLLQWALGFTNSASAQGDDEMCSAGD